MEEKAILKLYVSGGPSGGGFGNKFGGGGGGSSYATRSSGGPPQSYNSNGQNAYGQSGGGNFGRQPNGY